MPGLNALFHRSPLALVAIVGALFLLLSWLVALQPALALRGETEAAAVAAPPLTASEERGRLIYLKEGCGYCHSQFVRPIFSDVPYGRASVAADFAVEAPALAGTQRTGPDLSNVGARQPSWMWQFMHLYNPRAMVPQSIMPSFPWYFELVDANSPEADHPYRMALGPDFMPAGKVAIPTEEAIDLVAYLRTLVQ